MIATGYYGIPGRTGGKVHVAENRRPICGTHLDSRAEFQWCADGIASNYVECKRCKPKARALLDAIHAEQVKAFGRFV